MDKKLIDQWNIDHEKSAPHNLILFFIKKFPGRVALSSSMGMEDQVLTEIISEVDKNPNIFTLDTGRLFPETYDLIDRTSKKYGVNIKVYFPDSKKVEEMVNNKGINLFYENVSNRKLCCRIRKLEPLARAMKGLDVWITGLRKEQSVTRTDTRLIEWDESNNIIKINPLINWTERDVIDYIEIKKIPINPLHKKGYASIGCLPCTRAIEPGEDVRAGRWWWENPETKECGLHIK